MGSAMAQEGVNKAHCSWEISELVKLSLEGQKILKKEKLQERLLYVIYEISLCKSIVKQSYMSKVIIGLM